jgi:hypothetical protein
MKKIVFMAAVVGFAVLSPKAEAYVLSPGGSVSAATMGDNAVPSGTVIDSITNEVGSPGQGSTVSANLTTVVIKEAGGTLDFVYQVQNTTAAGGDWIHRATMVSFTGWSTNVWYSSKNTGYSSYFSNADSTSTIAGADRSNSGQTVGFTLETTTNGTPDVNSGIAPGAYSFILVIKTDATAYRGGSSFVIDGGVTSFTSFAPAPEPSSIVLAGMGVVFLGGFFWRRKLQTLPAVG